MKYINVLEMATYNGEMGGTSVTYTEQEIILGDNLKRNSVTVTKLLSDFLNYHNNEHIIKGNYKIDGYKVLKKDGTDFKLSRCINVDFWRELKRDIKSNEVKLTVIDIFNYLSTADSEIIVDVRNVRDDYFSYTLSMKNIVLDEKGFNIFAQITEKEHADFGAIKPTVYETYGILEGGRLTVGKIKVKSNTFNNSISLIGELVEYNYYEVDLDEYAIYPEYSLGLEELVNFTHNFYNSKASYLSISSVVEYLIANNSSFKGGGIELDLFTYSKQMYRNLDYIPENKLQITSEEGIIDWLNNDLIGGLESFKEGMHEIIVGFILDKGIKEENSRWLKSKLEKIIEKESKEKSFSPTDLTIISAIIKASVIHADSPVDKLLRLILELKLSRIKFNRDALTLMWVRKGLGDSCGWDINSLTIEGAKKVESNDWDSKFVNEKHSDLFVQVNIKQKTPNEEDKFSFISSDINTI